MRSRYIKSRGSPTTEEREYCHAAIDSKRIYILVPMCLTNEVKNDVDSLPLRDFKYFSCEILSLVIDSVCRTVWDRKQPVEFFLRRGSGNDVLPG